MHVIYPCRGESREPTTNSELSMKIQMRWSIWKMSSLFVLRNPYFLPIQVKQTPVGDGYYSVALLGAQCMRSGWLFWHWCLVISDIGQLKDRLRRLEYYGDMDTHPSETPRMNSMSYTIFDADHMPDIDARYSTGWVKETTKMCYAHHPRGVECLCVRVDVGETKRSG